MTPIALTRERFIAIQAAYLDDIFQFTKNELESRRLFERMAVETYDHLSAAGEFVYLFYIDANSAFNFVNYGAKAHSLVPSALLDQWKAWKEDYPKLVKRNPCLELHDVMHSISESDDASSWPGGRERHICDWVDASDPTAPPPFDDRYGIVTPAFFLRLRELRRSCGGWLYWSDKHRRVVFASELEWQKVRAEQKAADSVRRKEREASQASIERLAKRLNEIMTVARGDREFWNSLRNWELTREAKRPPERPQYESSELTGPVMLSAVQMSPEQREKLDNPPMDRIFADFIARMRIDDDPLTAGDIVLNLRGAMRDELGLDGVLAWKGGPGIGKSG